MSHPINDEISQTESFRQNLQKHQLKKLINYFNPSRQEVCAMIITMSWPFADFLLPLHRKTSRLKSKLIGTN